MPATVYFGTNRALTGPPEDLFQPSRSDPENQRVDHPRRRAPRWRRAGQPARHHAVPTGANTAWSIAPPFRITTFTFGASHQYYPRSPGARTDIAQAM